MIPTIRSSAALVEPKAKVGIFIPHKDREGGIYYKPGAKLPPMKPSGSLRFWERCGVLEIPSPPSEESTRFVIDFGDLSHRFVGGETKLRGVPFLIAPSDPSANGDDIRKALGPNFVLVNETIPFAFPNDTWTVEERDAVKGFLDQRRKTRKISALFIRDMGAGDLILSTPAIRAIKQFFGLDHVTFATEKRCAPLVHACPAVDLVVELGDVDLEGDDYDLIVNWCRGVEDFSLPRNMEHRSASFALHVGVDLEDFSTDFDLYPHHIAFARNILQAQSTREKKIAICVDSASTHRTWPVFLWPQTIEALKNALPDFEFVFLATTPLGILKPTERVIDLCGKTPSFHHAAAVVAECDLFFGPDSGLAHAAGAMGINSLVYMGMIPAEARFEHYESVRVITADPETVRTREGEKCMPCWNWQKDSLRGITDEVVAAYRRKGITKPYIPMVQGKLEKLSCAANLIAPCLEALSPERIVDEIVKSALSPLEYEAVSKNAFSLRKALHREDRRLSAKNIEIDGAVVERIGIEIVAPFLEPSGYASAARDFALSLREAGFDIALREHSFDAQRPNLGHDGTVLRHLMGKSIEAPDLRVYIMTPNVAAHDYARIDGVPEVCFFFWETDRLPKQWISDLNALDGVFVPCQYQKELCINSGVTVPVEVIGQSVDVKLFKPRAKKKNRNRFVFYSIFQWTGRKNPEALLRAYWSEFKGNNEVLLVVKTYTSGTSKDEVAALRKKFDEIKSKFPLSLGDARGDGEYPEVVLVTDLLSDEQISEIHRDGDVFAIAHRGEGFGLPIVEAMASGRPVIATNYYAPEDYLSERNSWPISHHMEPVHSMEWIRWYDGTQSWASPNIDQFKRAMREAYERRDKAKSKGAAARKTAVEMYSREKFVANIYRAAKSVIKKEKKGSGK